MTAEIQSTTTCDTYQEIRIMDKWTIAHHCAPKNKNNLTSRSWGFDFKQKNEFFNSVMVISCTLMGKGVHFIHLKLNLEKKCKGF